MRHTPRTRKPAGPLTLFVLAVTAGFVAAVLLCGLPVRAAEGAAGSQSEAAGCDSTLQTASFKPQTSSDWPMWGCDAARSAASPAALPAELRLQWVRELPQPAPAWSEEQYKLQFDRSYEPVVMGRQIFVPSMVADNVTAYDTETGRQNWQFFCDGPVRFAPIAWQGRVYFASDDGCLYCLDAEAGTLIWKRSLAPTGRKSFGNGRLISAWPARGGPVLLDGKIYCAASIWPFMGVFIDAVDAATGAVVWENSGTGASYIQQQHNSPAFAGVAPQGYLAAGAGKLLVTSRTIPACFDLRTGALLYYHLSDRTFGKHVGGCAAAIWNDWFFNNKVLYRLSDGLALGTISGQVMTRDAVVGVDATGSVMAYTLAEKETKDAKTKKAKTTAVAKALWKVKTDPRLDRIHLAAGNRLYGSDSNGVVAALRVPEGNEPAEVVWRDRVSGHVWSMLAGAGKLFVVTEEGQLYCFGEGTGEARHYRDELQALPAASAEDAKRIKHVLGQLADDGGYCLWLGTGAEGLLPELLRQSGLHVIVVEPRAAQVAALRRELDRTGLYGRRIAVLRGDLDSLDMPPYAIALAVVADPAALGAGSTQVALEKLYNLVRPYNGVAWLPALEQRTLVWRRRLPGVKMDAPDGSLLIRRTGPVAGSGNWTHQYGDVANTVCSQDELRAPLGILWFGEESAFGDVLPRHGHGPPEQVVDGRLFIEGIDSLSARDVYTGRTLWRVPLEAPGSFGVYYDKTYKHDFRDLSGNQQHIPGANVRGTNFVATSDRVYLIQGSACRVLDARTGRTEQILRLPDDAGEPVKDWGYIGVCDDCLIGGADFARFGIGTAADSKDLVNAVTVFDKSASRRLVVMNRYTGRVLWTIQARRGFLHNAIVADQGKIFCLDAAPPYAVRTTKSTAVAAQTTRRASARTSSQGGDSTTSTEQGQGTGAAAAESAPANRLLALDLHTGQVIWENNDCAFGSWLGYSRELDILLQAYRKARDMPTEPGDRMAALRGSTGAVLWDEKVQYTGPCMLHGGTIFTQESAYSLTTGRRQMRAHPLTGEPIPWNYTRNYGCNAVIASRNLLTFRSAAAGFYDLTTDAGTGNFGGFKSGCTSNLIVANGVLNAPDYTETCTCSYQNQTSLALIHSPEVETWSFSDLDASDAPIRRVGINLGAPGDRLADNGTLWLEVPTVGGDSPKVDVTLTPEEPSFFRRHSLRLTGGDLKWVEASGARGLRSVRVQVAGRKEALTPRSYTVCLHFAEPDDKKPGERVFDVALGDKTVLKDFDIVAEAKAPNVGIVKRFPGITATDAITVSLKPADPQTETILCGVEIAAETQSGDTSVAWASCP